MTAGRRCPDGHLPVYSVADEQEAEALIRLACPRDGGGQFYARELVQEQTLDNLELFSDRLDAAHDVLERTGQCRCPEKKAAISGRRV